MTQNFEVHIMEDMIVNILALQLVKPMCAFSNDILLRNTNRNNISKINTDGSKCQRYFRKEKQIY